MFSIENGSSDVGYLTCIKARKATNSFCKEMIALNSSTIFLLKIFVPGFYKFSFLLPSLFNLPVGNRTTKDSRAPLPRATVCWGSCGSWIAPHSHSKPFLLTVISILSVTEGRPPSPSPPSPCPGRSLLGPAPGPVQSVGPLSAGCALPYNWYQMRRPVHAPGFMCFWLVRLPLMCVPRCQGTDDAPAALSMLVGMNAVLPKKAEWKGNCPSLLRAECIL